MVKGDSRAGRIALGVVALVVVALVVGTAAGQGGEPGDDEPKFATGRVEPADLAEIKAAAALRAGKLSVAGELPARFDLADSGWVPPVLAQGNCGSCWDFAGSGTCTIAHIAAGCGPADGSFRLSEQFVLDCSRNGGCNGDDHSTVFKLAMEKGLPLETDYRPYAARKERCHGEPSKTYKIRNWGYCEPDARGPASTELIKTAMVRYGPVSVAIAADSAFMRVRGDSVFRGSARSINHEVILTGWDDSKGAWRLRNSWGKDWADNGYCWIAYGANGVGTDAAWVDVERPPIPPRPPVPVRPGWCVTSLVRGVLFGFVVGLGAAFAFVWWRGRGQA